MKDSIELAMEVWHLRDDLEAAKETLAKAGDYIIRLRESNIDLISREAEAKERADKAKGGYRCAIQNVGELQGLVASLKAEVAKLQTLVQPTATVESSESASEVNFFSNHIRGDSTDHLFVSSVMFVGICNICGREAYTHTGRLPVSKQPEQTGVDQDREQLDRANKLISRLGRSLAEYSAKLSSIHEAIAQLALKVEPTDNAEVVMDMVLDIIKDKNV